MGDLAFGNVHRYMQSEDLLSFGDSIQRNVMLDASHYDGIIQGIRPVQTWNFKAW